MAEMLLSKSASYGARPTIRVGGQSNPRLRELLIGMSMTENEGGLSALELRVSNVARVYGNTIPENVGGRRIVVTKQPMRYTASMKSV